MTSPLQGTVVDVRVGPGDSAGPGEALVVLESMKMQHSVRAAAHVVVEAIAVSVGSQVSAGSRLLSVCEQPSGSEPDASSEGAAVLAGAGMGGEPGRVRPELHELFERQRLLRDDSRQEATARRHSKGRRTARENVADLLDRGSFEEYGGLVIAAQRQRRELAELLARTPADGLVTGLGTVNGETFGDKAACAVVAYDYTVLAGTQGVMNHRKKDRLFELIERLGVPVVLFAEGRRAPGGQRCRGGDRS